MSLVAIDFSLSGKQVQSRPHPQRCACQSNVLTNTASSSSPTSCGMLRRLSDGPLFLNKLKMILLLLDCCSLRLLWKVSISYKQVIILFLCVGLHIPVARMSTRRHDGVILSVVLYELQNSAELLTADKMGILWPLAHRKSEESPAEAVLLNMFSHSEAL
ncbi:hypothetical protein GOODEAATRI_016286 [Goodea atripinnis]|uniref:Uncharacterized protein n=1 Tax=Goodea atripinnis TaxID=208336 RepID=A0ABV0NN69_9TELE